MTNVYQSPVVAGYINSIIRETNEHEEYSPVSYTHLTDLPVIYSMIPYTNEEIVSRNFVLDNKPKAIRCV